MFPSGKSGGSRLHVYSPDGSIVVEQAGGVVGLQANPASAILCTGIPWVKSQAASGSEYWIRIRGNATSPIGTDDPIEAGFIAPLSGRLHTWMVRRYTVNGGLELTFRAYLNGVRVSSATVVLNPFDMLVVPLDAEVMFAPGDRLSFSVEPTVGAQPDLYGTILLQYLASAGGGLPGGPPGGPA